MSDIVIFTGGVVCVVARFVWYALAIYDETQPPNR